MPFLYISLIVVFKTNGKNFQSKTKKSKNVIYASNGHSTRYLHIFFSTQLILFSHALLMWQYRYPLNWCRIIRAFRFLNHHLSSLLSICSNFIIETGRCNHKKRVRKKFDALDELHQKFLIVLVFFFYYLCPLKDKESST